MKPILMLALLVSVILSVNGDRFFLTQSTCPQSMIMIRRPLGIYRQYLEPVNFRLMGLMKNLNRYQLDNMLGLVRYQIGELNRVHHNRLGLVWANNRWVSVVPQPALLSVRPIFGVVRPTILGVRPLTSSYIVTNRYGRSTVDVSADTTAAVARLISTIDKSKHFTRSATETEIEKRATIDLETELEKEMQKRAEIEMAAGSEKETQRRSNAELELSNEIQKRAELEAEILKEVQKRAELDAKLSHSKQKRETLESESENEKEVQKRDDVESEAEHEVAKRETSEMEAENEHEMQRRADMESETDSQFEHETA